MVHSYRTYVEDPGHQMPPTHLSEDTYALAIEAFVVVTADIIIYDPCKATVRLAKRRVQPLPGWWSMGGRIYAGESEKSAAVRIFKSETGVEVLPDRLRPLGLHRYFLAKRKHEPQVKGADCLAFTFAVELSPEELGYASAHLDPKEYETTLGLREFDYQGLKRLAEREDHPYAALRHLYEALFGVEMPSPAMPPSL